MKVSLNTVKKLIDFELPPIDELVARINAQLGGVEEVVNLAAKYKDVKIVKVVECEKHPNADKLSVCKIDAGTGELVQVVCGAPNVRADMWAAWLPPESIVPATFDDKEPFVLGARELRGVMSNGMLAAGDELGINSDHDGIVEITEKDITPHSSRAKVQPLQAGAGFAEMFGLDDTIIDIENKMFTHRPDLFGQLGVAREIAGILGHEFTSPDWYKDVVPFQGQALENIDLDVFNDATDTVPRIMFVAMKNVEVKPSPLWLQCALVAMGSKSINNIVDATNYVMLMTAQPTHAYDYDKLRGHKIGARMAREGETLPLLNGKTYELTTDDIVIADGEGAIGLGGIMGGGNSEISAATKKIVLEVATFDMYTARKSSMRHGIFTDALARFNKGQSPLQNDRVLGWLEQHIGTLAGGQRASQVFDICSDAVATMKSARQVHESLAILPSFIRERLGLSITKYDMVQLLHNVEFPLCEDCGWNPEDTKDDAQDLHVSAPFWRTDIVDPEDVVEEIGRLYGFDRLVHELPTRSTSPVAKNAMRELKQHVRKTLTGMGANEVLTYSFIHENVLKKVGQNSEHAYKLSNALSPDLQYYRISILPSLLDKIAMNYRAGHEKFALYEIGKTHYKGEMDADEPSVPNEDTMVAGIIAYGDKQQPGGAPYYQALQYAQAVLGDTATLVSLAEFDHSDDEWGRQLVSAYQPNRSAVVVRDGIIYGVIGEFTQAVHRTFKLPAYTAGFELHFDTISRDAAPYTALSRFPSISQDISLKVASSTHYANVLAAANEATARTDSEMMVEISPVSIYQEHNDTSTKTVSLRIKLTHYKRTLTEKDASALLEAVASRASELVNATVA
ncbi:phenylalanine--tRNA ligase subunit beta [Candidatus Saccharibacteria bacterium]|nr:phenylalanine--tRNA ligase subunit beta [Candidatus Saccharibacteria bacterium]